MTKPPPSPNSGDSSASPATPGHRFTRRGLSLFDCVCIIVGTIIGSGIFKTPSLIAANAPNAWWMIAVWVFGGGIALIGALCFAELTTRYPDRGGDYGYLKRAFHRRVGFAFSWAAFWVIRPGNIGAMAVIFGVFAADAFPSLFTPFQFAAAAVVLTSTLNLIGVNAGKLTQNVLAVSKVAGILLIVLAALIYSKGAAETTGSPGPETVGAVTDGPIVDEPASGGVDQAEAAEPASTEWFWLSMVFVMYSFGGWNDIAFVATEVRDPDRNLLRSLMLGTGLVLLVYLLVNAALLIGLGFDRMSQLAGENAPFVLVSENLGVMGGRLLAIMVCVSCLGAISAMIFTSPRIYWATAMDYPSLRWLAGSIDGRGWWPAMLLQGLVTMLFVLVFGQSEDGFDVIVNASAPYFWLFLAMTVVGLMVCRSRYRGQFPGFQVPGYPVLPLLFVGACLFMVFRSWQYMLFQELQFAAALIGGWVLLGAGLSFVLTSTPGSANPTDETRPGE